MESDDDKNHLLRNKRFTDDVATNIRLKHIQDVTGNRQLFFAKPWEGVGRVGIVKELYVTWKDIIQHMDHGGDMRCSNREQLDDRYGGLNTDMGMIQEWKVTDAEYNRGTLMYSTEVRNLQGGTNNWQIAIYMHITSPNHHLNFFRWGWIKPTILRTLKIVNVD